jgi:hypothetical protein
MLGNTGRLQHTVGSPARGGISIRAGIDQD